MSRQTSVTFSIDMTGHTMLSVRITHNPAPTLTRPGCHAPRYCVRALTLERRFRVGIRSEFGGRLPLERDSHGTKDW